MSGHGDRAVGSAKDSHTHRSEVIPSLDGIRAISVLIVVLGHSGLQALVPGGLGVTIFFFLSGYLITTLLLRELETTSRIDLKAFYVRRAFRILPAYWLFLLVVLAAFDVSKGEWLTSFFFLSDYIPVPHFMGHTWTLSIEEQFYFLWPSILLLTGRRGGIIVASTLWILAPFFRKLAIITNTSGTAFQTQCDTLMVGCLLALWGPHEGRFLRWLRHPAVAGFSAVLLLVISPFLLAFLLHRSPTLDFHTVGNSVESVAIASVLSWALKSPDTFVGRLLNSRPLVHVGLISYSLYIWQQPILRTGLVGASWLQIALHVLMVFVVGELSFRFVETPMIAWGRRLRRADRVAAPNAAV